MDVKAQLLADLERVWLLLCEQHAQINRLAYQQAVNPHEMKHQNGQFVLVPILVAKADVLRAITDLTK